MGGFVSKNYMALVQIGPWLYAEIEPIAIEKGFSNVEAASGLMPSCLAYMSRAMQKSVTPELPSDADRHCKMYLNYLHGVDCAIKGIVCQWHSATPENAGVTIIDNDEAAAASVYNEADDDDDDNAAEGGTAAAAGQGSVNKAKKKQKRKHTKIEKRGNLTLSLSTGREMQLFGSVRSNLWDGHDRSENVLRCGKHVVPAVNYKGFAVPSMDCFYQAETIGSIESDREIERRHYMMSHKKYDSIDAWVKERDSKVILSGVLYGSHGQPFIEVGNSKDGIRHHELLVDDSDELNTATLAGAYYSPVSVSPSSSLLSANQLKEECLYLLPYDVEPLAMTKPSFWFQTSEFRVRYANSDRLFMFRVPGAQYQLNAP